MPQKTPGHNNDSPSPPEGGNNANASSKNNENAGPLTPDDIVGLTDEERQSDKIKTVCDRFNKKFNDCDPAVVRVAIKKADSEITLDDLRDIDHLEAAVLKCLKCNSETSSTVKNKIEKMPALAELLPWVTEQLPNCKPHKLAAQACLNMQKEEHDDGDPEFKITDEDPEDIETDVKLFIEETLKTTRNATTTAQIKDGVPAKVPAEVGKESSLLTDERGLQKEQGELQKEQGSLKKTRDKEKGNINEVKQLQSEFETNRANGMGTIAALRNTLAKAKAPKMKAIVQRVLSTATALINAVNNPVVERLMDRSNINLGASSPLQIFAGFLAEADKSDELTEEEKKTIRRVIGQSEKDFKTGTDAQKIAHSKEQVIDPETGEVISEKYTHDGPNNMAVLRPNLGTYMDGERMMIATKDGHVKKDVTGWSSEDIGMLAEVMDFHRFAEEKGITGFVESIANTHYDISGNAFNREKMIQTRQVISALVGMGEGYDGDVFNPEDKALLLTNQLRVLTNDDQAISWHNNESGTGKILQEVGFRDQDGKPNLDVISAFGSYMQDNLTKKTTKKDVQKHLHKLFPNKVKKPEEDESEGKK